MVTSRAHNTSPVSQSGTGSIPVPRGVTGGSTTDAPHHGDIGYDREIVESGDLDRITGRLEDIYANRAFDRPDDLSNLAQHIAEGRQSFADVRQGVDSFLGSDAWTRGSVEGYDASRPALDPNAIAEIASRRRDASRRLEEAQVTAGQQRSRLQRQHAARAEDRERTFDNALGRMMGEFGDRGLAFQPAGAGQGRRELREERQIAEGRAQEQLSERLAQIAEQVEQARRQRERTHADLDAHQERLRAQAVQESLAGFDL